VGVNDLEEEEVPCLRIEAYKHFSLEKEPEENPLMAREPVNPLMAAQYENPLMQI